MVSRHPQFGLRSSKPLFSSYPSTPFLFKAFRPKSPLSYHVCFALLITKDIPPIDLGYKTQRNEAVGQELSS